MELNDDAKRIIDRSEEKIDWQKARAEWQLIDYMKIDGATCEVCGKHPIKNVGFMFNPLTNLSMKAGTCCATKYWKENPNFFAAMKERRVNAVTIAWALRTKRITGKQHDFMQENWRKRKFTARQLEWRERIITKMFSPPKPKPPRGWLKFK